MMTMMKMMMTMMMTVMTIMMMRRIMMMMATTSSGSFMLGLLSSRLVIAVMIVLCFLNAFDAALRRKDNSSPQSLDHLDDGPSHYCQDCPSHDN